jgi:hypothetical protein
MRKYEKVFYFTVKIEGDGSNRLSSEIHYFPSSNIALDTAKYYALV